MNDFFAALGYSVLALFATCVTFFVVVVTSAIVLGFIGGPIWLLLWLFS